MSKLYTIAGTSIINGITTYRFATGDLRVRVRVLKRNDHTDIQLFELAGPMTKDAAIQWLNSQGIDARLPAVGRAALTAEQRAAIQAQRIAERAEAARLAAQAEAAQLEEDAKWVEALAA